MAFRSYSKEEFEEELKRLWGLAPTDQRRGTFRIWKTPSGKHLTVPELPEGQLYPHYYVGDVAAQIKALESAK